MCRGAIVICNLSRILCRATVVTCNLSGTLCRATIVVAKGLTRASIKFLAKESLYLLNNREISDCCQCSNRMREEWKRKRCIEAVQGTERKEEVAVVERGRARRSNKMETAGWANNEWPRYTWRANNKRGEVTRDNAVPLSGADNSRRRHRAAVSRRVCGTRVGWDEEIGLLIRGGAIVRIRKRLDPDNHRFQQRKALRTIQTNRGGGDWSDIGIKLFVIRVCVSFSLSANV